jgi:RimJ/RimL family protein N-acetyltransferase
VVSALVAWAWTATDVGSILATVVEGNTASVGVLERVGDFRVIGTYRSADSSRELVYRPDR